VQRQQQLAEIHQRHPLDGPVSAISRQFQMNRRTVRNYIDLQQAPVRGCCGEISHAVPFLSVIRQLWGTQCTSYLGMLRELHAQHGFTGSYSSLRRLMNRLVDERPGTAQRDVPPPPLAPAPFRLRSTQQTAWALVCPKSAATKAKTAESDQTYIARICAWNPGISAAYDLTQRFVQLVRTRDAAGFDAWLADTEASGIRELVGFAGGLRTDYAAVANALTQLYSNDPVEVHIHRLKLMKRSMYHVRAGEL
jgi:hypothetical protein